MKKTEREREARREYRKGKKEKADINELFILDIMREGIKMEMHAYSEDYLLTAQRILGDMLDYAVNEYEFDPDEFYKMF